MFSVESLDHVALIVSDLARSESWYRQVLGLTRAHADRWGGVPTILVAEDGTGVALFPAEEGASPAAAPSRKRIAAHHFAFRVSGKGFLDAQDHLKRLGIAFEFQDHEVCQSIYFNDPDGHQVELTTYEMKSVQGEQ